jgi:SAM-dependent methyltransferase
MPSEQTQRHYCGEAGRRYHDVKRRLPERALPWVAALRARKFAPFVGAGDVVLEYGAGAGWNLAALSCRRKIGFDVAEFLEPSLRALGIEFVADTKALEDSVAGVVICHHTLEHVPRPAEVLGEIRRLLKPQGRLLLFVPFERETRYERFDPAEPNHHLFSWNVQSLGNLVVDSGFEVSEAGIGEFGYSRFSAVWADRLGLGERGFRVLRRVGHLVKPAFEARVIATKPAAGVTSH